MLKCNKKEQEFIFNIEGRTDLNTAFIIILNEFKYGPLKPFINNIINIEFVNKNTMEQQTFLMEYDFIKDRTVPRYYINKIYESIKMFDDYLDLDFYNYKYLIVKVSVL